MNTEDFSTDRRDTLINLLRLGGLGAGCAALGVWLSARSRRPDERQVSGVFRADLGRLATLQTVAAFSPIGLYVFLVLLAAVKSTLGLWILSQVYFPALAVLSGLLGGYQFPVASRIFFGSLDQRAASPGTLYGFDFVGACVAAVILSVYLVPVFGFLKTAVFMGVVNLAPAGLAGFSALECRAARN